VLTVDGRFGRGPDVPALAQCSRALAVGHRAVAVGCGGWVIGLSLQPRELHVLEHAALGAEDGLLVRGHGRRPVGNRLPLRLREDSNLRLVGLADRELCVK
jgi:hypothetical protein